MVKTGPGKLCHKVAGGPAIIETRCMSAVRPIARFNLIRQVEPRLTFFTIFSAHTMHSSKL